ncbi:YbjN domain-containing protein [Streptomyces sp. B6B3]|uniref:YbjN domain-containing protein n=1 Tax=Streptomyces sp. B6B3 TaxID=3153570 RepID=UPI00325C94B2
MSMDPSAIPNFGSASKKPEPDQQGDQAAKPAAGQQPAAANQGGQPAAPTAPVVPDKALIKQLLDRMKLKHTEDKQGDVVAPWKSFRTYFMFRGENQQQVLSVRTFYDRPHTLDQKPELLESLDDWNRRTLWPKVYTHTSDEGTVRLIGEVQMLIGVGVALDHFVSSMVSWVRASIEFDKWLTEQLGPVESDEESGATEDQQDT